MATSTLRDTVLRAAVGYIAEHGPDGLSFRQVAAAAGVSHQAPYHHFADRRGVFEAISVEGYTMLVEALRDAVVTAVDNPTVALLERYVDFALEHPGHFRVMFRTDLNCLDDNRDLHAIADSAFVVLLDDARRSLGAAASADEARLRARSLWALAHGLATLLIDGPLASAVDSMDDQRALVHAVIAQSGLTA